MKVSLCTSNYTPIQNRRFMRKCQTIYNEPNNTSCSFQSLHTRKIFMLRGGFYVNPVFCVNYCTVAFFYYNIVIKRLIKPSNNQKGLTVSVIPA